MSTCPSCHQAIPVSCKNCDEQIVFMDGKPMSYRNHYTTGCGHSGKAKPTGSFGKPSIVTSAEQKSFDEAVAKAEKDG